MEVTPPLYLIVYWLCCEIRSGENQTEYSFLWPVNYAIKYFLKNEEWVFGERYSLLDIFCNINSLEKRDFFNELFPIVLAFLSIEMNVR